MFLIVFSNSNFTRIFSGMWILSKCSWINSNLVIGFLVLLYSAILLILLIGCSSFYIHRYSFYVGSDIIYKKYCFIAFLFKCHLFCFSYQIALQEQVSNLSTAKNIFVGKFWCLCYYNHGILTLFSFNWYISVSWYKCRYLHLDLWGTIILFYTTLCLIQIMVLISFLWHPLERGKGFPGSSLHVGGKVWC